MQNTTTVAVEIGGKTITIETGLLARQAGGSVTTRIGDTVLLSAATCTDKPREGIDYFPLQVEYREKYYASGRFPGGYFKRETRPSERETLIARLTDRPIRALFPKAYRNDVQIHNILLSADLENDTDAMSVVAASAALTVSEIPFMGPIGAVRVARVNGHIIFNPTHTEREGSDLDLLYCGTREHTVMIEGGADQISEADMVSAMKQAHAECVKLIDGQIELRRKLGLPAKNVADPEPDATVLNAARELAGNELREALLVAGKADREDRVAAIKESLKAKLLERLPEMADEEFRSGFDALEIETVRANVLEHGRRIDGRAFDVVRPLAAQVGLLPRTHGSAVFNRGETQALGIVTLGTKSDTQELDAIAGGADEKKFMLHYNFPPFSTGEVGRIGTTGRREIGHGALAERSILPVIPKDYPYTVRVVSEIMGSNGSSSMASVCVSTLALMDAGVPIVKPVAGISVGLFTGSGKTVLVTDILGSEDHCGDMDFKVAGTRDGITGFQVDLKIRGLPWDVVIAAFEKARVARLQILDFMAGVIPASRPELSPHAPRIRELKIPVDKIGELIGPGGKNIRRITELSGAQIDIEDDGSVLIFATNAESMELAEREVMAVAAEPEEGKLYEGTVTGIKEFGCFVEILPGRDGLCHISELADFRVRSVEDVCKIGDRMWVKCIGVDDRGRVKLSRKEAMRDRAAQGAG
jgi:polyribonucleotide nucleotidyltransferase